MSDFRYYRPNNFPPVVKNLIIINVIVWAAQQMLGQYHFTERISLYPIMPRQLHDILVSNGIYADFEQFQPYQIATHMFAHGPLFHILFNMFALWMFGRILENVWGPKRFLLFYLICGVGAAACHLFIQYLRCEQLLDLILTNPNSPKLSSMLGAAAPAVGASGAIMGLLVAFAYLFPNTELYLMFIPVPVKAKWAILVYVLYDLIFGITGGDNVAHFAHLGGAITGFVLVLIWNKRNRRTFY